MAFIPEAIVSKIVEELIALPIEELKQHVRLVVGVKDQVKKLTKNFKAIQAVVADAERKQIKDANIKLWLDELKEISYEMDDVLDEWRSALLLKSRNLATASSSRPTRKVFPFITSGCFHFHEIGGRRHIALKIKDLNEELKEIAQRRNDYQLVPYMGVGLGEENQQRTTVSTINIMKVKGRAGEKERIINMLSASNDGPVPQIVSIVGMGGLGKTTLAQLVYNDDSVKNYFSKRIWVCVSEPFDEIKIANAILESLGGVCGTVLENVLQNIISQIKKEKYLLVLHDVWNEDPNKWEKLQNVLISGLLGSTILITTRKERVAKIMGCKEEVKTFRPAVLSNEECWSIICNEVELSGMTKEDLQQLQDIGIQIARKCKGLPLAAKALGGLLRFKVSKKEWQSVLDSEMWELGEEAAIEKHLFAPLCLSYHDLSAVGRQCLSYCVLFPKDYEIPKDDLIQMWMSQDYLKDAKTKDMKIVGGEVFRNLCARSFFQDFKKDLFDEITTFKIHDIVHDFILFISNKECLSSEEFKDETIKGFDKSLRHLLVLPRSMNKFGNSMSSLKKLRSLNVSRCKGLDLCRLFKELTCLRSLFLSDCDITEIPSEIGRLIHLRLLDVSYNEKLRELPKTIGDLCNLLIIKAIWCNNLKELTRRIEKVSNLQYLLTDDGVYLTEGVGRLHALREATFLVRSEACSLEYLKNMNHLNSVEIRLRRYLKNVNGAKQAQLSSKKDLVTMSLYFASYEEEYGTERDDEEVLEALQPCSTLETLRLNYYRGADPNPSWLLSLQHLRMLKLFSWQNCKCLPLLGKLPSITHLQLSRFGKLKKVGVEFLGIDVKLAFDWAFPKLKFLRFEFLEEWEEWEIDDRENFSIMPCLTTLSIRSCNKLKAIPDHLLQKTTLKDLDVGHSSLLEERYKKKEGMDSSSDSYHRKGKYSSSTTC